MALFNLKKRTPRKTVNRAGGKAFQSSNQLKLVSLLLTSFAQDQYYRKSKDAFKELVKLLPSIPADFAAKAAIYARTEFGMRSISHVLAAELAAYASGRSWAKHFYKKIVYRPDDMTEILAYFYAKGGSTIPNAMKKGFAKAFDKFDAYQLAKYRKSKSAIKLVDVLNLVHPKPTQSNRKALQELVDGNLRNKHTWEARLTGAGQEAKSKKNKKIRKAQVWKDLLDSKKLGYFALLRNLRNIAEQAPDQLAKATELLMNKTLVKRSMVLPFRFLTAIDAISTLPTNQQRLLRKAINKAMEHALDNVPIFKGNTLIALDDSGSMTWGNIQGSTRKPMDIGALFASALYKSNNADLMVFSNNARYKKYDAEDSLSSMTERLVKSATSGGTNFHSIFQVAKSKYDRIIIISDMQAWKNGGEPSQALQAYRMRMGISPFIYSFDLCGYGSLQFPQNRVFAMAGFSEKVFDVMKLLETDRNALIHTINSIPLE